MKGLGWLSIVSVLGMIIEAFCELAMPTLANNIYNNVSISTTPEETRVYVLKGFGMLALAVIGLCRRPCHDEKLCHCKPEICL